MLFHHADSSLFMCRKFDFCKIKQKFFFKLTTSYIQLDRIWPNNFFLCVPKCWKAFTFHPYKGGMIKGKKGPFEKQEQNQEVHAGWVLKGILKVNFLEIRIHINETLTKHTRITQPLFWRLFHNYLLFFKIDKAI